MSWPIQDGNLLLFKPSFNCIRTVLGRQLVLISIINGYASPEQGIENLHKIGIRPLTVSKLTWNEFGSRLLWAETGPQYSHISMLSLVNPEKVTRIPKAHVGRMTGLEWCHHDRIIVSCGQDGFIKIFGIRPTLFYMHSKMIHERGVLCMSINGAYVHCSTLEKAVSSFRFRQLEKLLVQTQWKEVLTATRLQAIFRGKNIRKVYLQRQEDRRLHCIVLTRKIKHLN